MNESTDNTAPSTPKGEMTPADEIAARQATAEKATQRLTEIDDYFQRIDKAIASVMPEFIAEAPLGDVVDVLATLSGTIDKVEKSLSAIKGRMSFAKEVSMPARMDAEKAKTFNTDNFRVTRTNRVMASILADELERAYKWLRDNDYGALIKETVNSSSLSGAAKELMENGKELPDDMFRTHMKDGISITKKR